MNSKRTSQLKKTGPRGTETHHSAPLWRRILFFFLLLAVPFFVYQKTIGFSFVNWDDPFHTYENPAIRSWDASNIAAWFQKPVVSLYIPVPMASFAADYRFSGDDPAGYHRTNLAIHLLNTLLVFLLFRFLFKNEAGALLGALLFALHPLQAETVAWISARKTLLFGFFSLSSFYWALAAKKNRFYWPVLLLLFLGALLSKIAAIMLPLVLFLFHHYEERSERKFRWAWLFIPAAAGLALTLPLYWKFFSLYQNRLGEELFFNPLLRGGIYFKNALLPFSLRLFYPLDSFPLQRAVPFCLLSSVLLIAPLWGFLRKQFYSFWMLWSWLWLFPVLTLLAVPVADHHFYLSVAGISGAVLCLAKYSKKAAYGILIAANLACIFITPRQLSIWKNSETLWSDYLSYDANDYRASIHLADYYQSHGQRQKAAGIYEKLTETWPKIPEAYLNLANLYLSAGNNFNAVETANRLEKNIPGHAYPFLIRGLSAMANGEDNNAISLFEQAKALSPSDPLVLINLGRVYLKQKKYETASGFFLEAAKNAKDGEPYYYLALLQNAQQQWKQALAPLKEMHSERLYFPGSYFQEAYAYLKLNKRAQAERLYRKSIETDPARPEAYLHLGLMKYQDGQPEKALPLLEEALARKPGDTQIQSLILKIKNPEANENS